MTSFCINFAWLFHTLVFSSPLCLHFAHILLCQRQERRLQAGTSMSGSYINIGANDGLSDDPLAGLQTGSHSHPKEPVLRFPLQHVTCSDLRPGCLCTKWSCEGKFFAHTRHSATPDIGFSEIVKSHDKSCPFSRCRSHINLNQRHMNSNQRTFDIFGTWLSAHLPEFECNFPLCAAFCFIQNGVFRIIEWLELASWVGILARPADWL